MKTYIFCVKKNSLVWCDISFTTFQGSIESKFMTRNTSVFHLFMIASLQSSNTLQDIVQAGI